MPFDHDDHDESPAALHRIYGMPGHLIRRAHQITTAAFMDTTKAHNLTPVQYAALTVADSNPGIDQQSLANMVAFDRATIGDVIQRLEQRGLLERANGKDRRTKRVFITRAGERTLNAMDKLVMESQIRILQPLSDGEQIILMFLLSKLVNLHNDISPTPLNAASGTDEAHQTMRTFLRSTFTRPDHHKQMAPPEPAQSADRRTPKPRKASRRRP